MIADDSAFPLHEGAFPGLTKRELFAAMAMQGLAADPEPRGGMEAASVAVEWADALIAELAKT